MEELIEEVEKIISTQKHLIERNKKYHEYPFMDDCHHYYRLIIFQNTLEVWERCYALLLKYKKSRCSEITIQSAKYEKIIEFEAKYGRSIPRKIQSEMVDYMKNLEWQLDVKTSQLSN